MADPIAPEVTLRRGLAQYLADHDVAVYRPVGAYTAGERGIYTLGAGMPTVAGSDNALVLRSLQTVATDRADMLYRVQIESRIKGSPIDAENLAAFIASVMDQKQDVPPGLHIAWCSLFSQLAISADSSGRCGTFQTFHLMGRRGL
ncbi:hypothetical protein [Glaciihabitans sp. dw_435]|uniref:hypothetical protein n=1 Tax=Glaciihabitans sp. dw_435 TaxID=2720081 RepID=UPI001BD2F068|nr:hypothetical protein [Glaciihabitans sp. dw_435]